MFVEAITKKERDSQNGNRRQGEIRNRVQTRDAKMKTKNCYIALKIALLVKKKHVGNKLMCACNCTFFTFLYCEIYCACAENQKQQLKAFG